jgi:hypothetical protein
MAANTDGQREYLAQREADANYWPDVWADCAAWGAVGGAVVLCVQLLAVLCR